MEITKRKRLLDLGIIYLWAHWLIATAALITPAFLGLWVPKTWLPLLVLLEIVLLFTYIREAAQNHPRCYLIINIAAESLTLSMVVMLLINLLYATGYIYRWYPPEAFNLAIPYITTAIISPCTLFVSAIYFFRGRSRSFCRNCIRRYGNASERGFIGRLYKLEGHFQVTLLMTLSAVVAVFVWTYYSLYYININYNRPDLFFFVWMPLFFFLAALIYMTLRYAGLLSYYSQEVVGSARQRGAITEIRYIVIHGNDIFLSPIDPGLSNTRLDTPVSITINYRKEIPLEVIRDDFKLLTDGATAEVKYIYTSETGNLDGTILHYVAFIDDPEALTAERYPGGIWVNFHSLKRMANARMLAPILSAEIARIYLISMAYKTYDINGHRRYRIKSYRPAFTLPDILELNVDYNDNRWLFIGANNEDRPLFRLRRIVKKILYKRSI